SANGTTAGDAYRDGETFSLTLGSNTVTFELEEIAGAATSPACFGSGTAGGNGFGAGNVPVYFRQTISSAPGYSQGEMVRAFADAINSSILVTNGTSYNTDDVIIDQSRLNGSPAVFIRHLSGFGEFPIYPILNLVRRLPLAAAPMPFTRIVNNTIIGSDGQYAFNPEANTESNDTMSLAIDTHQGRQFNSTAYTTNARIGDNATYRLNPSLDVDFYSFNLDVGDRVTIDLDTPNAGGLNSYMRLFNDVGQQVAFSDNTAAPGEVAGTDSYLDFTALKAGTYYVAISGAGNSTYDPQTTAGRTTSTTTGVYQMSIDVKSPKSAYLELTSHSPNG
ncbi:MAG TPA: PPC domain-containing protein, partial [Pirellulaceae bacterium]|nr:PPC domain-containing protein [Pirellulaceae bacterium]